jgi:hypothetical protein
MDKQLFDEPLRQYLQRPFKPFLVELSRGDRVRVDHPEFSSPSGDLLILRSSETERRLLAVDPFTQLLYPPAASP